MAATEGLMPSSNDVIPKSENGNTHVEFGNSTNEILPQNVGMQEEGQSNSISISSASEVTEEPVLEININNVVGTFSTRCHLNLRRIALEGSNVVYKKENGMCNMKLRNPNVTATIWSSGKITTTGSTSEEDSKIAARRVARQLQHLGFDVRFCNFRVVNVLGTCSFPFGIRITLFSREHKEHASYEPEIHPGVTYRIKEPKATLKIFSTGSITVTAPSVHNVQCAIEHIFPLVSEFKSDIVDKKQKKIDQKYLCSGPPPAFKTDIDVDEEEDMESEEEEFDSDESQD